MSGKVFGVGLSRTGTKSLHLALERLGYRSVHYPCLYELHEILKTQDAATDIPVACCYRELDEAYPESRFILTTRDLADWLESTRILFCKPEPKGWKREVRLRTYGVTNWDREAFTEAYNRHIAETLSYFSNRQILVMDITAGDGWKPLCRFLDQPEPDESFPHANSRLVTMSNIMWKMVHEDRSDHRGRWLHRLSSRQTIAR